MNDHYYWNAHRRAGLVIYWLAKGAKLSTREIARKLNMTPEGAAYLMDNLSGSPLMITKIDDKWQIIDD